MTPAEIAYLIAHIPCVSLCAASVAALRLGRPWFAAAYLLAAVLVVPHLALRRPPNPKDPAP